jgi:hypothetical protein
LVRGRVKSAGGNFGGGREAGRRIAVIAQDLGRTMIRGDIDRVSSVANVRS